MYYLLLLIIAWFSYLIYVKSLEIKTIDAGIIKWKAKKRQNIL